MSRLPMFRFTIRDVLWLMVVVGLGAALIVERRATRIATDRANNVLSMFEILANFAAWEEDWKIKTTDSSLEIHRPLPIWRPTSDHTYGQWEKTPAEWNRLKKESLVREFSRNSLRERNSPIALGPLPEEKWKQPSSQDREAISRLIQIRTLPSCSEH